MVDTGDLKSPARLWACRFNSCRRHHEVCSNFAQENIEDESGITPLTLACDSHFHSLSPRADSIFNCATQALLSSLCGRECRIALSHRRNETCPLHLPDRLIDVVFLGSPEQVLLRQGACSLQLTRRRRHGLSSKTETSF